MHCFGEEGSVLRLNEEDIVLCSGTNYSNYVLCFRGEGKIVA